MPTNLITNVVTTAVNDLAARIATLPADTVASLEATATLDHDEWFFFGDKATLALSAGRIDLETATALHAIHTSFNTTATLAERIVFLQVMDELR